MNVRTLSIARAVSVIGGTAALVAGITFAATQTTPVSFGPSTLAVDASVLQIFDFSVPGYSSSTAGVNLTLVPGVESTPKPFYLKNLSGLPLAISAKLVGSPVGVANSNGITVKFYDKNNVELISRTLTQLATDQGFGGSGNLPAGAAGSGDLNDYSGAGIDGNYKVSFTLTDPAAVTGVGPVTGLNLDFTGTF